MPGAGHTGTALATGFEAVEEALRDSNPQNVVQQLQHAFRTIVNMNADELVVAAQTMKAMAAMDSRFKQNPVALSIANAIRQRMDVIAEHSHQLAFGDVGSQSRRFRQAFDITSLVVTIHRL